MASTDIMQDTGYENLHGFNEVLSGSMSLLQGDQPSPDFASGGPVPAETVKANMTYLKGFKAKRDPEVIDIINQHSPENEMVAYYSAIADRLRRRGAPVEFDEQKPWGDPDALKASFKYAAGRQWAFSMWGTPEEQATSNQTIAYLRQLPLTDSELEKLGVAAGVEGASWDGATIGGVVAAMRHTDDDFVHKLVYDGWMFGTSLGQSPFAGARGYAEPLRTRPPSSRRTAEVRGSRRPPSWA